MEKLLDKFLRYVSIDTMSDPESETQPSSEKQFNLLRMLRDELEAMGIKAELDEFGYVMATIPSNIDNEVPAIGFIAHVDTSPDASGKDVKPQIIENYQGGDIMLNAEKDIVLKVSDFPEMQNYIGKTMITTDGTTLLGADDKGGIAAIMYAAQYLMEHP
ncbi:MAG: peptidase T, partial [Bacteroidales bacterium]|nr:peptidase T [Bacteroidales bacterium]